MIRIRSQGAATGFYGCFPVRHMLNRIGNPSIIMGIGRQAIALRYTHIRNANSLDIRCLAEKGADRQYKHKSQPQWRKWIDHTGSVASVD